MIDIDQIVKRYGTVDVLKGVSMEFRLGTLTALIGANGSGKSTLLSAVGRLVPHEDGVVNVAGEPLTRWDTRSLAQRLAVLRQSPGVDLRLTVEELVEFGRFPHNKGVLTDDDRAAVERAIRYLDLGAIRHASIHTLSGGQKQRAFIAMVIAQDTDYILLDEPLNNLDMRHAGRIMAVLTTLAHRDGRAVVVVLHDINMAAAYADYIVALRDGAVVHAGDIDSTMQESVMERVFGVAFPVVQVGHRPFCIYHMAPQDDPAAQEDPVDPNPVVEACC